MAAGDFTAAGLQKLQLELKKLFANGPVRNDLNTPIDTAKVVLGSHGLIYNEKLSSLDDCLGVKAFFLRTTDADNGSYDGTVADATLACQLPEGDKLEAEAKEYGPNVFSYRTKEVKDNLCANEYQLAELAALQLAKAMAEIRGVINTRAIQLLNANAQSSTNITADLWTPDLIARFYQEASIAQMPTFQIHNGSNFFQSFFNAQYNALNDNQRDQLAKFGFPTDMTFDIRALDAVVGSSATFVFSGDNLGFFCKATGNYNLTMVDTARNLKEFLVDDPILMYRKTTENGSVMVPVTYKVEYEKVCDSRNANSERVYIHRWTVKLVGGLVTGPLGPNNETNILKYVKTPVV